MLELGFLLAPFYYSPKKVCKQVYRVYKEFEIEQKMNACFLIPLLWLYCIPELCKHFCTQFALSQLPISVLFIVDRTEKI